MPFWSKKDHPKSDRSAVLSTEELVDLAKRYVVQETIGPLKRIAKVLGIGLGGAVVFGLGAVIVLIGVLRLFQTETGSAFAGNWTFVPYLLTAVAGAGIVAAVALLFMKSLRASGADR